VVALGAAVVSSSLGGGVVVGGPGVAQFAPGVVTIVVVGVSVVVIAGVVGTMVAAAGSVVVAGDDGGRGLPKRRHLQIEEAGVAADER
jgi:hypothetical protein